MNAAHPCRRPAGFTLLELFVALAVISIIAALGMPAFKEATLNSRRTSQLNTMLRSLHFARTEAIKRAVPIAVCKSSNGWQCTPEAANWSEGYIVFANEDRDSPPRVDRGEEILFIQPRIERLRIDANRDALLYWPVSLAGTTASIVFCDERGPGAARAIVISHTGRPRVSQRDASGRALRCT